MESSAKIKKSLPLVYYRMPDEKKVSLIQSNSIAIEINSLQNLQDTPGFILHPFSSLGSSKPLFIKADNYISMSIEGIYKSISDHDLAWEIKQFSQSNNASKTKEEYCKIIENAIAVIHSTELQKVVFSRMKSVSNSTAQNPVKIFCELCNKYPTAFVSLVYIPGQVSWVTATPELLLSINQHEIKTVSLAGTKSKDSIESWGEKEKMEQQIVTDYINGILQKYCKNIAVSGPQEITAGNVKHLKTSFSATLNSDVWSLVSALHPTPAVCGIPLNRARQFIEETEGYDRKYYAGFLGPCNINGKTNLFVNLRCGEIFTNALNLYMGGGITKDSVPESEWNETELKAKTILSVLEENINEAK